MVAGGGFAGIPPARTVVNVGRRAVVRVFVACVVLELRYFVHPFRDFATDAVAETPKNIQASVVVKREALHVVIETTDYAKVRGTAQIKFFDGVLVAEYTAQFLSVRDDEAFHLVDGTIDFLQFHTTAEVD